MKTLDRIRQRRRSAFTAVFGARIAGPSASSRTPPLGRILADAFPGALLYALARGSVTDLWPGSEARPRLE
jgi:hypothetical protein